MARKPTPQTKPVSATAKPPSVRPTKVVYDYTLQLISTFLIPVTVAGVGWYYTRWQQNLNDLKTMIELVTDDKTERRKYGVAMFEYLLKNDKVPVEFVTAQLNFANSSADQTLLTQLEQAINKAAAVNSSVEKSYREAMLRLPSRLFISVRSLPESRCVRKLVAGFHDGDRGEITIPSVALVPDYNAPTHELRYFKVNDRETAENIIRLFARLGLTVELKDFTTYSGARDFRPNTFELWIGQALLPPLCTLE